jgi:GNAT superfamily N-acetyltransferase
MVIRCKVEIITVWSARVSIGKVKRKIIGKKEMMTHTAFERHSSTVEVRVLEPTDAADAAAILARAFDQEPAKLTLMPNSAARRMFLELILRVRLYDPLRYGAVHGAQIRDDLAAIAVWYPPGVSMLSMSGAIRAALSLPAIIARLASGFPHMIQMLLSDIRGTVALVRTRRPAVARATQGMTWYLGLLGTLPEHRGKGLARALLDRQLHRCDQDNAAVWLETTDPINPKIYERFGFQTVAHSYGPSWLPGYWMMRREPHAVQLRS